MSSHFPPVLCIAEAVKSTHSRGITSFAGYFLTIESDLAASSYFPSPRQNGYQLSTYHLFNKQHLSAIPQHKLNLWALFHELTSLKHAMIPVTNMGDVGVFSTLRLGFAFKSQSRLLMNKNIQKPNRLKQSFGGSFKVLMNKGLLFASSPYKGTCLEIFSQTESSALTKEKSGSTESLVLAESKVKSTLFPLYAY
ncbi:hypothetical protein EGR_09966 [Echinococcus granulosus]|uniref:Uncharacterized protein n=1 Tax=Echinococcus granulosus TaxID=6210 RepID=W6U232_ECHGR|nr:hypothetical protein EGR_09966 [Echinococcus granulosus]EUB55165.1 hypothetical protein EGR_09966 [Echinococcus granulosus]